jgi:hypothetical protein
MMGTELVPQILPDIDDWNGHPVSREKSSISGSI